MNVPYIIKDFILCKGDIQKFINHRYKSPLQEYMLFNSVKTIHGGVFIVDDMFHTIRESMIDYHTSDIRQDDVVLDIGGCIGGFGVNVCSRVKKVYIVEPILTDRLKHNIEITGANNIIVMDTALGNGYTDIDWGGIRKIVKGISLTDIINSCDEKPTFIKCDCEGGEHSIKSGELDGIRAFEGEIHTDRPEKFLNMLRYSGFKYSYEWIGDRLLIVHARR